MTSPLKIIHFSDSHAGGPAEDWMAYIDKRWVGVFNFRFRRRFQHNQMLLKKLVDYALQTRPDLVVCTGDLTSTGQRGEFQQALSLLQILLDHQIPILYVPGNHDYYVYRPQCVSAMKEAVQKLNVFFDLQFDHLPVKKSFCGLDFLLVNESWPTFLLSSCGYLKADGRRFILDCCAEESSNPRILVAHYPLIEDHPWLRFRHRLWGQSQIMPLFHRHEIALSLCGHVHKPYCKLDAQNLGELCAGSITRNGCFVEILYDPDSKSFSSSYLKFDSNGDTPTPFYPNSKN